MTDVEDWRVGLARLGLRDGPACSKEDLDEVLALGVAVPADLRRLYLVANGLFDTAGQWWVVWPLDRVVQDTADLRAVGLIGADRVAFGDDGTGNPFTVRETGDRVERWSLIGGDVEGSWASVAEFIADWFKGLVVP